MQDDPTQAAMTVSSVTNGTHARSDSMEPMEPMGEPMGDPGVEPLGLTRTRVLVTGGSGLLGRALLNRFLPTGARVATLSRREDPQEGFEHFSCDLSRPSDVEAALEAFRPEVLVHLAAMVGDTAEEEDVMRVNHASVVRLHRVAARTGCRLFVAASSVLVTGVEDRIEGLETDPYTRTPWIPYVRSKIRMEKDLLRRSHRSGPPVRILRFPRLYGSGESRILPPMIDLVSRGRMILIDRGQKLQSFLHVDDASRAILLACSLGAGGGAGGGASGGASGPGSGPGPFLDRVYQIVHSEPTTQLEILRILAQTIGCPVPRRSVPFAWARVLARIARWTRRLRGWRTPGLVDPFRIRYIGCHHHYSGVRAAVELGFEARIPLHEGLPPVVEEIVGRARGETGS